MSCNYPMIRAETFETFRNQKGGISYKAEFIGRDGWDKDKYNLMVKSGRYKKVEIVGCGQCTGCLLNYSRDRATQMMCEKKYGNNGKEYPEEQCWFITCTYADEYLKTHVTVNTETGEKFEGVSLDVDDHIKFMKRLRKKFKNSKIKFVVAGEYGSKTQRPHLHYILFGVPLDMTKFKKVGMNALNQPTWVSEELNKIWGMGHVEIGRVDWRSCAYVARYTLKKAFQKDKLWYQMQGMKPEFIIWSNGIGKTGFTQNKDKIYKTDTVPITTHMGGLLRTPKSYDRMLKEIDPELYSKIKEIRTKHADTSEIQKRMHTDLTPEERRIMQEARMKQVMKDIRTEV